MPKFIRAILCAVLYVFLMILSPIACFATGTADYSTLFREAVNAEESEQAEYGAGLSDAFINNPIGFVQALSLEDPTVNETVCHIVASHNLTEDGNAAYIQFVLPLFSNSELTANNTNTLIALLLRVEADLSNATPEFADVLFDALPYLDGMAADYGSYLLCQYFLHDSSTFVRHLAARDTEFQELVISMFIYGSWGYEAELENALALLLADSSMLPEEHRITGALLDRIEVQETLPQDIPDTTNPALPNVQTESYNSNESQVTAPVHPVEDSQKSANTLILPGILGFVAIIVIVFTIYIKTAKKKQKSS